MAVVVQRCAVACERAPAAHVGATALLCVALDRLAVRQATSAACGRCARRASAIARAAQRCVVCGKVERGTCSTPSQRATDAAARAGTRPACDGAPGRCCRRQWQQLATDAGHAGWLACRQRGRHPATAARSASPSRCPLRLRSGCAESQSTGTSSSGCGATWSKHCCKTQVALSAPSAWRGRSSDALARARSA